MNRETIIQMAREAGFKVTLFFGAGIDVTLNGCCTRLAWARRAIVRAAALEGK